MNIYSILVVSARERELITLGERDGQYRVGEEGRVAFAYLVVTVRT